MTGRSLGPEEKWFEALDAEDLTALTAEELEVVLGRLVEEERVLDYRLEVLRGRIALIRAKVVGRGATGVSDEELAWALVADAWAGHSGERDVEQRP